MCVCVCVCVCVCLVSVCLSVCLPTTLYIATGDDAAYEQVQCYKPSRNIPETAVFKFEKLGVMLSKLYRPQSAFHAHLYAYQRGIRHKTRWVACLPKLSIVTDAASPRSSENLPQLFSCSEVTFWLMHLSSEQKRVEG